MLAILALLFLNTDRYRYYRKEQKPIFQLTYSYLKLDDDGGLKCLALAFTQRVGQLRHQTRYPHNQAECLVTLEGLCVVG